MAIYIGKKKQIEGGGVYALKTDLNKYLLTTGTAANSTLFNGKTYSSILERASTVSTNSPNQAGWYRVAQSIGNGNTIGKAGIIILDKAYNNTFAESFIIAIALKWNAGATIKQLAGNREESYFGLTKIRVDQVTNGKAYIDVYMNQPYKENWGVTCIGGFQAITITKAPDTATGKFTGELSLSAG